MPPEEIIATWMIEQINNNSVLFQKIVINEIMDRYGNDSPLIYRNKNHHWAIHNSVLKIFNNLKEESIQWHKGKKYWYRLSQ